jgi:hypothetical protein
VLEASLLADFDVLVNLERERIGGVEDGHLLGDDLDLARGKMRVLVALRTLLHGALDLEHVLIAEPVEDFLLAHHDLRYARCVTQVDERHPAMVAAAGHPSGKGDGLSNMLGTQRTEVVCAQHSAPLQKVLASIDQDRSLSDIPESLPARVLRHARRARSTREEKQ